MRAVRSAGHAPVVTFGFTVILALTLVATFLAGRAIAVTTINCPASGTCYGTTGDDEIYGRNDKGDVVWAYAGSDWLIGRDKNDELHGGSGTEDIVGGNGGDDMWGGTQSELFAENIVGFDGADTALDVVSNGEGNPEFDQICLGRNDDYLDVRDAPESGYDLVTVTHAGIELKDSWDWHWNESNSDDWCLDPV